MSEEVKETKKTESTEHQARAPREERDSSDRPERHSRDDDSGDRRKPQRPRYRKKVLDTRGLNLDYKNNDTMERFISKTGKILPRRMTGASAKIQRKIAREVKRARMINLLPITRR